MTNLKKQIFSVITAGVMVANVATPALAGTEIVISGNGAGSDNWATVGQTSTTTVTQNNQANVTNNVSADAKTGNNDASFNTGGDVNIDTGDAKTKVDVSNVLNSNSADVDCCAAGDTEVKISGNGAKSDNGVKLEQSTNTTVDQDNDANVTNNVDANAKTGYNDASKNTGGEVSIKTGKATSDVDVATVANVNSAKVGSGHGSNPSASFIISGNGAGSDNYIGAVLANETVVSQDNDANVTNDVDAKASTGGNDAGFNTGGEVHIMTGDAKAKVDVDNSVNFNFADVDCGCVWDVLAKIEGNGAEGDNHHKHRRNHDENLIELGLETAQVVGQGNVAYLNNDVDGDAKTGYNDAESNTGEADGDPSIVTGDAKSATDVSNSGNVNSVGDLLPEMPEMPEFEFSFNFAAMMAFFGLSI
jgi:hypothetical protein